MYKDVSGSNANKSKQLSYFFQIVLFTQKHINRYSKQIGQKMVSYINIETIYILSYYNHFNGLNIKKEYINRAKNISENHQFIELST